MLTNYLTSLIRTAVPVLVGAALTWLAGTAGVVLDDGSSAQLTAAVTALAIAVYYALIRALEERWPALGWLLGAPSAPTYGLPPARTETEYELFNDGSPRQIRSTTVWPPRPERQ